MFIIKDFFDQLILGNASIISVENIRLLNEKALYLYNEDINGNNELISELKYLIMSCNILYNRTDMTILPIEDGFYDLLLEKYKLFDPHFQVGSAIVDFKSFIENDINNPKKIATSPIIFEEPIERDEIHQEMRNGIVVNKYMPDFKDFFHISPISFESSAISKRTHNTEHNHPSLVGTLDKAKFVLTNDAVNVGAIKDSNVKILERDFFMDHISKGIISPNQIIHVVTELKYDGISVEADCGLEVQSARTRGDTGIGEAADISPILQGYIFKHAGCMIGEQPIGVKFEAIITKTNLARFNELRGRNYSNCRTAIIGLFGASDAADFKDLITLVPLALDREDIPQISNRMEEIEFLNKVFISHGEPLRYCYMSGTVSQVLYMIKAFWDEAMLARDYLDFMYDGIVVSYLDEDIRNKLGRKNYINKYSMAVKFDPLLKQTIFRGYTYEVGQHGTITPMIHYDPIEFIGTIHTKSTGSSMMRFKELGLKYGDYINVTYTNDVMPYVTNCDCEHNRNNTNEVIQFITHCPICGSELVYSDSGKSAICPNKECPGRSIQRMTNMFAKLNIKGFAESTFTSIGKTHLYELYQLDLDYLIEKLGNVDGYNFYNELNRLRSELLKDYIILGALGFTSMAHKKWQSILKQMSLIEIYDICNTLNNADQIAITLKNIIPNLGEITALTIAKEFDFFKKDIELILSWNNLINSYGAEDCYKAQIRFTGIRNKQLSELLINAGYDADDNSAVTKKTNILLVPYDGFTSSKVKKASSNCKVVAIDEFINNMEKYIGENLAKK